MILIVSVSAVAVLSILTLSATQSVMQELRLARFVTQAHESYYAGLAAVRMAQAILASDATPSAVTLFDLREREVSFGEKKLRLRMTDEEGFIDLGGAAEEVLVNLPGIAGDSAIARDLAQAAIYVKEDALLVGSVDQEIYAQFAPYVTTFTSGGVNINTAGGVVLGALGMSAGLIDDIIALRVGADGQQGTADDYSILSAGGIITALREGVGIDPVDETLLTNLVSQGQLSASSNFIRVEAVIVTGSRAERSVKAVLHIPTGDIAAWYEE